VSVVTWLLLAETIDRLISAANARRAHGDGGDVLLESANDKATRGGRKQPMARANTTSCDCVSGSLTCTSTLNDVSERDD
jgi:hypothetical protein